MDSHSDTTTLRSLGPSLSEDYVRNVLQRVQMCERELGDARVHVSRNADITPPHYSIAAVIDLETGETTIWQSFSGKTHKPLSAHQLNKVVWSPALMTLREVSELIGEIRNFAKANNEPSA